jgi:molecular chaperone DnaJ
MHRACSSCEGTGVRSAAHCSACLGRGSAKGRRQLTVKLPAGVQDGAMRSVRGEGEQTARGKGDLHIYIKVKPHPLFTREGADLHCEVPITFPQAALGAQIEVPTLEGKVTMRLPAGTQSGKVFRLRGKGLPALGGYGKGDELVTVVIEVPETLSERERELLEQLASEMAVDTHLPRTQRFLDKLRKLF